MFYYFKWVKGIGTSIGRYLNICILIIFTQLLSRKLILFSPIPLFFFPSTHITSGNNDREGTETTLLGTGDAGITAPSPQDVKDMGGEERTRRRCWRCTGHTSGRRRARRSRWHIVSSPSRKSEITQSYRLQLMVASVVCSLAPLWVPSSDCFS